MENKTLQQLVSESKNEIIEVDVNKVREVSQERLHLIVDVREPGEFAQGYIEGAINVPRGVLEFRADPSYPGGIPSLYDKSAEIFLYCRSGARSALAAKSLTTLGYKAVASMAGGFIAWQEASLPVVVD
jgi:rhodanese-related sulfurtransferase